MREHVPGLVAATVAAGVVLVAGAGAGWPETDPTGAPTARSAPRPAIAAAATDAATDELAQLDEARAERARASRAAAREALPAPAPAPVPPPPLPPRAYAQQLLAERGWAAQWPCLDKLWTRESGWSHTADNPRSSAYGIPQALPGAKMASAGADWQTNPQTQIRWGLSYIAATYGGPCRAWQSSQSRGYY